MVCKVSIILPVYNVEKYLERCLLSLINQTFKDIEIIAINDGSTDNSLDILKNYSRKDTRISIISKNNEGVSKARNIGIEKSCGEFIVFIDSDDWVDENMIEIMYSEAKEKDADLVMCTYIREFENHSRKKELNYEDGTILNGDDVLLHFQRKLIGPIGKELSNPEYLDSLGSCCAKMYKSKIVKLEENRLVDINIIGSAEDVLFNINILQDINKLVFLQKPLYHYWKENNSSQTTKYRQGLDLKWEKLYEYINNILEKQNAEQIFYEALNNRRCIGILGLGLNEISSDNRASDYKKIKKIKCILNNEYTKIAFKNFELKYLPIHWRIFYVFCKYRLAVFVFLMLKCINLLRRI